MKSPGVSSRAGPPVSATAYMCGQLSASDRKVSLSFPAQFRFAPPAKSGKEPRRVSGLVQTTWPLPVAASAVQIAQGEGTGVSRDGGGPPSPGRRAKASLRPSGDQTGCRSWPKDGAIQRIGAVGVE